uniref:Uncharacterized protein n=1 Tax=Cucumis sativus TaxID=3659 RepID=A0A0A0LYF3_CUCSA
MARQSSKCVKKTIQKNCEPLPWRVIYSVVARRGHLLLKTDECHYCSYWCQWRSHRMLNARTLCKLYWEKTHWH